MLQGEKVSQLKQLHILQHWKMGRGAFCWKKLEYNPKSPEFSKVPNIITVAVAYYFNCLTLKRNYWKFRCTKLNTIWKSRFLILSGNVKIGYANLKSASVELLKYYLFILLISKNENNLYLISNRWHNLWNNRFPQDLFRFFQRYDGLSILMPCNHLKNQNHPTD